MTWSCDCEACNISWIQLPYGTLGDLAKAPQLGQNVLVTHQPWRRKEKWASVQWFHSPGIAPEASWSSYILFQLSRGKGLSTVETTGRTHGCWLLGKPETRPVLFCLGFGHLFTCQSEFPFPMLPGYLGASTSGSSGCTSCVGGEPSLPPATSFPGLGLTACQS